MKLKLTIVLLAVFSLFPAASAQEFGWSARYRYYFDNNEFDRGGNEFMRSMTINAMKFRLTGEMVLNEGQALSHGLELGLSLKKDMGQGTGVYSAPADGADTWRLLDNVFSYYHFDCDFGAGRNLTGIFGIYPSDCCEEEYSRAFVSDSLRFYDDSYEGMMFKYSAPKARAELWLDWMGIHGVQTRERFRVVGAALWSPLPWLGLGADVSMYHFAGSKTTPGVVDNVLANPYVRIDLSSMLPMDELSLKAGVLASYQRDRKFGDGVRSPAGGEMVLRASKWGFGIDNTFYCGDDIMPFYNGGAYGHKFASDLYFGSPFYRSGTFDRLEAFYAPRISDKLSLKVSAVFHFADSDTPYQGTQQILSLLFKL